MAGYLLDTNHLTYVQDGHPMVVARLKALTDDDRIFISVVNIAELLQGVHRQPPGAKRQHLLGRFIEVVRGVDEVLPITIAIAEQFANLDAAQRQKGKPIPIPDMWLAASAIVYGAILVTNDGHFSHVDGLRTANWTR